MKVHLLRSIAIACCASMLVTVRAAPLGPENEPLAGPATRVATLDFIATEIVLLLDVTPVAVAAPDAYRRWAGIRSAELDGSVPVGLRQEPDLERLAGTRPDLIVGDSWRHGTITDVLKRIAPVAMYDWLPPPSETNQLERMVAMVRDLGGKLGKEKRARRVIAGMRNAFATRKTRLVEAGHGGTPVVVAQHVAGTNRFNLYADNSLGVRIAEAIGLQNQWHGDAGQFGYQTVDLATLAGLEDAHILLMTSPGDQAFAQLRDSSVWQSLPAVQKGHVHVLPEYTWFFGGPAKAAELAGLFADVLNR